MLSNSAQAGLWCLVISVTCGKACWISQAFLFCVSQLWLTAAAEQLLDMIQDQGEPCMVTHVLPQLWHMQAEVWQGTCSRDVWQGTCSCDTKSLVWRGQADLSNSAEVYRRWLFGSSSKSAAAL